MFDNIGEKIKTMAQVVCWVGIIASCICGIYLMIQDEDAYIMGLFILILGSLFSWICSFLTYGFGQLIENSDILISSIGKSTEKQAHQEYVEMLENAILCNNCGADISNDYDVCHVCGKNL